MTDDKLRRLAEAATPGGRQYEYKTGILARTPTRERPLKKTMILYAAGDATHDWDLNVSNEDADFIAACDPGTIIGLLDRLQTAEARAQGFSVALHHPDLPEKVAAALWSVYIASPIAREGAVAVGTWEKLTEFATFYPQPNAADTVRNVGLDEARAVLRVIADFCEGPTNPQESAP